jgi:hypothetical protein
VNQKRLKNTAMVYTRGLKLKYIQGPHLDARKLQIGRVQNISGDRRQGSNVTHYVQIQPYSDDFYDNTGHIITPNGPRA